jgi:hypothetical protein
MLYLFELMVNGIDAIHYSTYFESGMAGSSCAIKFEEWNNLVCA